MAEWFKALVLKTRDRKVRGFESYSLRHLLTRNRRFGQIIIQDPPGSGRKSKESPTGEMTERPKVLAC
jgi:hypothetical protein